MPQGLPMQSPLCSRWSPGKQGSSILRGRHKSKPGCCFTSHASFWHCYRGPSRRLLLGHIPVCHIKAGGHPNTPFHLLSLTTGMDWLVLILLGTHSGFGKEPSACFSPAEHVKEEEKRPYEPLGLEKFPVNPSPASSGEGSARATHSSRGRWGEGHEAASGSKSSICVHTPVCVYTSVYVCVCTCVCVCIQARRQD